MWTTFYNYIRFICHYITLPGSEKNYLLNFVTNENCSPFSDVISEIGVLLFIVERDNSNLQRSLSYLIITCDVVDY